MAKTSNLKKSPIFQTSTGPKTGSTKIGNKAAKFSKKSIGGLNTGQVITPGAGKKSGT